MKRWILLLIALLLGGAGSAAAQTGALTSMTIQFRQNGAPLPAQTTTIALPGGAQCGLPLLPTPPPAVTCIDTTGRFVWTDPATTSLPLAQQLNCQSIQGAGSTLLSLPNGANYSATGTFTNDYGRIGPESPVSNTFTRGCPVPPAPSGVQILR